MGLIYDIADPQELAGFVRGVQRERDENQFVLSRFLPNQNIDELEWRVTTGQFVDEDAATVRAWDTESPIGGRQGVKRLMGELPPISKKYRLGEEDRLRKRMLDRGGDNAELVNAIFNDAEKGARSVAARIEMFRGEALWKGKLQINENGVQLPDVDFGRAAGHTVSAATVWSNHTIAILTEELAWRQTYIDTNGVAPGLALISEQLLTHILLNDQYRSLATYSGITPAFLNLEQVNQVRSAHRLPPLYTYDVNVRVDGVATRVIPADKLVYVPPAGEPLGKTFSGTTAEAIELAGASQIATSEIAGMVSVVEKTFDPVATWTKTAAIALPVLMNPDLTFCADVL